MPQLAGSCPADKNIEDVLRKTKSKRKHKQGLPVDAARQEAIRQKIAASMAKKAARVRFSCPACGVTLTRADGVLAHMERCCADLLEPGAAEQVGCRELYAVKYHGVTVC